jgi:hypothetical protein
MIVSSPVRYCYLTDYINVHNHKLGTLINYKKAWPQTKASIVRYMILK